MKIGAIITTIGTVDPEIYRNHLSCLLAWGKDYDLSVYQMYDTMQHKALNSMIDCALEDECTHLFFMEHDNLYNKDTLSRLVEQDKDYVTGYYTFRNWPYDPIPVVMQKNQTYRFEYIPHKDNDKSLIEAELGCLGCSLIKTEALKRVEKPYFTLQPTEDKADFLLPDVVFFKKLREAGIPVLVDGNVRIGHLSHKVKLTPDNYKFFKKMIQVGFPEYVTPSEQLSEEARITEIEKIFKKG